jgi:pimeloyl-ACP methyl ester carboxylesterase
MFTAQRSMTTLLAAAALGLVLVSPALAGPPMICHPVDIGDAESLPWGARAFDEVTSYRLTRLADDTLDILMGNDSALVHMETLRRAAIYSDDDRDVALDLLAKLMARALDAEAAGKPDPLAWLDAGYFAQSLQQLEVPTGLNCGSADGVVGYGWVRRALELRDDDPELEFAAAMMTVLAGTPQHEQHAARAGALADADSLVAANLETHSTRYWAGRRRATRD